MIKKVSVLKIADPLFCSKEFKDKVVFSVGQDPEFILSVFNDCYFFGIKFRLLMDRQVEFSLVK